MSIFYVVFSILDLALLLVGDFATLPEQALLCANSIFILPRNDFGCAFLFANVLIFFAFTYNINHIFY
jgi:hypothetical protein